MLQELSQVATFDDDEREFRDADILVDGPIISAVGPRLSANGVDRVVDGRGMVALPGLINAHQHVWQAVARGIPDLERGLFEPFIRFVAARPAQWWREGRFGPNELRAVARAVFAESLLGGVTTVADQHLLFPGDPDSRKGPVVPWLDAIIQAAGDVGIRVHAGRGTVTRGPEEGGPADTTNLEPVDTIIRHCRELIERYHDPRPGSKVRVDLAPSGVHLDLPETFEAFAVLAEEYEGVRLHTHLYEKLDAELSHVRYGMSPWRFLQQHGWGNDRVFFAHVNDPPPEEIQEFANAGVGVVHMVASDLRLGWGLAPIRDYLDAGVKLGFGTTGASVNDTAHLLADLRLAFLAHRARITEPDRWLTARELLRMATRGSAACLGRDELGSIEPGKAADIACWDMTGVDRIGAHDLLISLVLSGLSHRAGLVILGGEVVVDKGEPTNIDLEEVARAARHAIPE